LRSGETGKELAELIKKAIDDCKLTETEYREILNLASDDSVIDSQERELLRQLHMLIANNTIERIPD
jgi:hypothetical protein